MQVKVGEGSVKDGVLGLVLALVEIIKETLEVQTLKRIESGRLTRGEVERLGLALESLDSAVDEIKVECGIEESVRKIRQELDNVADDLLDRFTNPERWVEPSGHRRYADMASPSQAQGWRA